MTTLDPSQSVEFEPVPLGRRRRRVDPLGVGVLIAVIGLVAAIAKPWDAGTPDRAVTAAAATAPTSSASDRDTTAALSDDRPVPATGASAAAIIRWTDLESVIEPHDGWGVRIILRTPDESAAGGRTTYLEHWVGAVSTARTEPHVVVQAGGRSVVALGITFPAGLVPLDVRIWSRTFRGTWRWLDARPLGRLPAQRGLIFVPPTTSASGDVWGAGEYRIDALIPGGTIQRIAVDIPDRYEQVRPATIEPTPASELVPSSQVDPAAIPVGAFATIDRVGWSLDGIAGSPLEEAGAWLDTDIASGRAPQHRVSVAYLPRATGLGVRLPDGSAVRAATLTRLAPDAFPAGAIHLGGDVIDHRTGDPWVVFAARRGEAWDPGSYRIDVTWADPDGVHDASWHIELRPGPSTSAPPLLAIARAWARHAGTSGIVVGRAEPLEGGPRSSAIRRLPIVTSPDAGVDGACPGTVVDGSPEAFGLAYPAADPVQVVWVRGDGPEPRASEVPTFQAAAVVPGLTLIVPTDGATFEPGVYYLGLLGATGQRVLTLCVGGAGTVGG